MYKAAKRDEQRTTTGRADGWTEDDDGTDDARMDGRTHGWTDGRTDGRTDDWTDGQRTTTATDDGTGQTDRGHLYKPLTIYASQSISTIHHSIFMLFTPQSKHV